MYASTHIFTELNPFETAKFEGFFFVLNGQKKGFWKSKKKTFMYNQIRVYSEVYPLTIRKRIPPSFQ